MLPASALLDPLRYGELLPPKERQVAESLIAGAPTSPAKAVAAELASKGLLTPYQADELAAGRGYGLAVGSYVLLAKIGAGGMGEVFKARHRIMGRDFALKRMLPSLSSSESMVERFVREVRAASMLSHPNVVTVHFADRDNGVYYLVMELLEGINLADLLLAQHPLSIGKSIEYVRQACVGMQHAHEKGLVHRDLKPTNLMLTTDRRVKILDLGLALVTTVSALTQADAAGFGTWDYMAPEQAANPHKVDVRADVFSLGCTLYHLLTGRTPFDGPEMQMLRPAMHLTSRPTPVEKLRREVPKYVADTVRKMMAPLPEKRFQTPGEAATLLGMFVRPARAKGTTVPVSLPPKPEPTNKVPPTPTLPTVADALAQTKEGAAAPAAAPANEAVNSLGMRFVLVRPGTFSMGSPAGEDDRDASEARHEVSLSRPYYLGVFPVTQKQWLAVMGGNPSHFSRRGAGRDKVCDVPDDELEHLPVEGVTWGEACEFLRRLGRLDEEARLGHEYRLPTEAEWEFACRGGHHVPRLRERHGMPFHFEQPTSTLSSVRANFDGRYPYGGAAEEPHLGRPSPVGRYAANALGLHDMHGNVWEWCADWYGAYPEGPVSDPVGQAAGEQRVLRGGSWLDMGGSCRAAARDGLAPETRESNVGFRAVLVLPGR